MVDKPTLVLNGVWQAAAVFLRRFCLVFAPRRGIIAAHRVTRRPTCADKTKMADNADTQNVASLFIPLITTPAHSETCMMWIRTLFARYSNVNVRNDFQSFFAQLLNNLQC